MFQATYLGHQGWFFSSGNDHIVIDPLFMEEFGRGPDHGRFPIFPPRDVDLGELPRLSAVILSHEHEDHFDLRTLHRFPRGTPIYLSARSSSAGFSILRKMGFEKIHRWKPGDLLQFGSLFVKALAPDHWNMWNSDEWDTLPYLVYDKEQNGSFFTTVDVGLTPYMVMSVESTLRQAAPSKRKQAGTQVCRVLQCTNLGKDGITFSWSPMPKVSEPFALAKPEVQPENSEIALTKLKAAEHFSPLPGLTMNLRSGKMVELKLGAEFLACKPRSEWPPDPWADHARPAANDFFPVLKSTLVTSRTWIELEKHLRGYAAFLYASVLYRRLHSLTPEATEGKIARYALFLRYDAGLRIYEYVPGLKNFRRVERQRKPSDYMIAVEFWAQDLLALFDGLFEARVATRWHSYWWISPPVTLYEVMTLSFIMYFHPLNRPSQVLRRYREVFLDLLERDRAEARGEVQFLPELTL